MIHKEQLSNGHFKKKYNVTGPEKYGLNVNPSVSSAYNLKEMVRHLYRCKWHNIIVAAL